MLSNWRTFQVVVSLPDWRDHCKASNVTARLVVTVPGFKLGHCYAEKKENVERHFFLY